MWNMGMDAGRAAGTTEPERVRELLTRICPSGHVDVTRPETQYCIRHGLIDVRRSPMEMLPPKWVLARLTTAGRQVVEVIEIDEVWHDIQARMGGSLARATPAQILAVGLSIICDHQLVSRAA